MTRTAASCTRTAAGSSACASFRSHASTVIRAAINSNSACTAGIASVSSGAARSIRRPPEGNERPSPFRFAATSQPSAATGADRCLTVSSVGSTISSRRPMPRIVARCGGRGNAISRANVARTSIHEGPLPKGGEGMMVSGSQRWCCLTHKAVGLCDRREENPHQPPAPFSRGERKCSHHQFISNGGRTRLWPVSCACRREVSRSTRGRLTADGRGKPGWVASGPVHSESRGGVESDTQRGISRTSEIQPEMARHVPPARRAKHIAGVATGPREAFHQGAHR